MSAGRAVGLLAALAVLGAAPSASATSYTWDGGGATNDWNTAANWHPDGVPGTGAGDTADVGAPVGTPVLLDGTARAVATLSGTRPVRVSGTTLTLSGTSPALPPLEAVALASINVTGSATTERAITLGRASDTSNGILNVAGSLTPGVITEPASPAGLGLVHVLAGGTVHVDGTIITTSVDNDGTVTGTSLTFNPTANVGANDGDWTLSGNLLLTFPRPGITLDIAGSLSARLVQVQQSAAGAPDVLKIGPAAVLSATKVALLGSASGPATLDLRSDANVGELDINGGVRRGTHDLAVTACPTIGGDSCLLQGATFSDAGTTTYTGPVSLQPSFGFTTVDTGHRVRTTGAVTWGPASQLVLGNAGGSGVWENAGTIVLPNGGTLGNGGGGVLRNLSGATATMPSGSFSANAPIVNTGSLAVNGGTLGGTGSLTQTAGGTSVASGAALAKSVTVTGGTLGGSGTVGSLSLDGTGVVSPGAAGPGTLHVSGAYGQAGGTLRSDVDSTSAFDVLSVGGAATLSGGRLEVDSSGFTPAKGDTFGVLTAASRTGTFDELTGAVAGGVAYTPRYDPDGVVLEVVDAPVPPPPPPPAGPAPPSPPSPPTPDEPAPAQAAFVASDTSISRGELVSLDASDTFRPGTQPTELAWNLDADAEPEAVCEAHTPVLTTRLSATTTVGLTVTDARGRRSTTTSLVRVATTRQARAAASGSLLKRFTDAVRSRTARTQPTGLCTRPSGDRSVHDSTANGGPEPGCVAKAEVRVALVAAVGCLQDVPSWSDVPASERGLVARALGPHAGLPEDIVGELQRAGAAQIGRTRSPGSAVTRFKQAISDNIWVARSAVRINGLDYTPAGGTSLVIVKPGVMRMRDTPFVIGSKVEVTLPVPEVRTPVLRKRGELVLPIDRAGMAVGSIPIDKGVAFLPKMRLVGSVRTSLLDQQSVVRASLQLPAYLSLADGGATTVAVQFTTSNRDGVKLAGFRIDNVDATLFGVGIHIDFIEWDATRKLFAGRGSIDLGPQTGRFDVNRLEIVDGDIAALDFGYAFPAPGIKVAPGVFLVQVGAFWVNDGAELGFGGNATFSGGPGFGNGCGLVSARGDLGVRLRPGPFQLTVDGQGSMGCIDLIEAHGLLRGDGYASLAAKIDKSLGPVSFRAQWKIEFSLEGHFTGQADAHLCIEDLDCLAGTALISDRGLAACADFGFTAAGFGLNWPIPPHPAVILANLDVMLASCDVGPWRTVFPRARAAQAGPMAVTLPGGARSGGAFAVVGADTAPRVTLRGPDGTTIAVDGDRPVRTPDLVAFRQRSTRTTYALVRDAAPGTWTAEPVAGDRITELRAASTFAKPVVAAKVVRRGRGFAVRATSSARPGRVTRFFERTSTGMREIGSISAPRTAATLPFVASETGAARRSIVAMVEQDGKPREQRAVATFRATPPRIAAAKRIRLRRARGALVVTFARARNAEAHAVVIRLSDGRAIERRLRGRAARVRIGGVARGTVARVAIIGTRVEGRRRGSVARASRALR